MSYVCEQVASFLGPIPSFSMLHTVSSVYVEKIREPWGRWGGGGGRGGMGVGIVIL